jgi:hypothetical protein
MAYAPHHSLEHKPLSATGLVAGSPRRPAVLDGGGDVGGVGGEGSRGSTPRGNLRVLGDDAANAGLVILPLFGGNLGH